jgi:tyrosyl-tRNA synthetase
MDNFVNISMNNTGFVEELRQRGMLHDMTPGVEDLLKQQKVVGYIGFDPTAPSLTIGNLVQIQILSIFQKHGHTPIVLMGGATGRIGDPSFKDKERELKSEEEIERNLEFQILQMKSLLNFETGQNKAILFNNYDIYKNMNVLDFLRDIGKTLTVSYMMSKDSVKNRLETGLSFTEFSYQLIQGYDFQYLFENYNCMLQMGGSDQWGNITAGSEFVRRNLEKKVYALTTPLLTKSDGTKFGKSESGNVWLDRNLTSPYKFYQFWINCDDADVQRFFYYFSLKEPNEIGTLLDEYADQPGRLKVLLADELTTRIHSQKDLNSVKTVSEILFNQKLDYEFLQQIDSDSWENIFQELPHFEIQPDILEEEVAIDELLTVYTSVLQSKSDVRRAVKNNALSINKNKITSHDFKINETDFIHNQFLLIENGKKNKFLIRKSSI